MGLLDRIQKAWNVFIGKGPPNNTVYMRQPYVDLGYSTTYRPDRLRYSKGQERTLVNAVYNRIAMDVAAVNFRHIETDDKGRYKNDKKESSLNNILSLEANKDQTARQFIQDIVMSMFDEGCVAIVPIDWDDDPKLLEKTGTSCAFLTMRVAKVIQWYPDHVRVEVYDDNTCTKKELTLAKSKVAIVENPFYAIMNEPNSITQRLIKKFNLLDVIDAQSGSGKLNLIIQLPYVIKTEARQQQAAKRQADIEKQLRDSQYGIAYTDGTEKVTQLNRPAENNLLNQIQYLTSMLFSQLGVTEEILNGTADENTMQNYMNRCVNPICRAITEEMNRKFLTKTARTQGQKVEYFNEPFKLIPIGKLPEVADKLTRNEIVSSNEIRQWLGLQPSDDPRADELVNKNISQPANEGNPNPGNNSGDSETPVIETSGDLAAEILKKKGLPK